MDSPDGRPGRGVQRFTKYDSAGAYHWKAASDTPWWNRAVPIAARYELAVREIERVLPRGALGLDAGCGDGVATYELTRSGYRVVGLDGDHLGTLTARDQLRSRQMSPRLLRGNVCSLPFESGRFMFVVALEVIEHLSEPRLFFGEVHRVLMPSGIVVISTPRASGPLRDSYHVHEFSPDELKAEMQRVFASITVRTFNPRWLATLYRPRSRWRPFNRALAVSHRALCRIGLNPFVVVGSPFVAGDDLLAVARK